jgi:DNA-binding PadR family transcriptional regulator
MSDEAGVLQGALDLMVLQTLDTMGPQRGLVRGKWSMTQTSRRARYDDLTAAGRRQLGRDKQAWDQMAGIIHAVLQGKA